MSIVDLLIVIACLASLAGGFRRGFWLSLAWYAGMVAGFVLGLRFAPDIVDRLGVDTPLGRQLAAILVIVLATGIGGSIGFWVGGPVRRWLLARTALGILDSLTGAAFSAAVTLVTAWVVALTFARGPSPELARAIQQSRIVARLDAISPEAPAFIARAQQVLSGTFLPPVFTGIEPDIDHGAAPSPDSAATAGVRAVAGVTVKVEGRGCGGIVDGSGFPVAPDVIVTNAHVVSGTGRTTVTTRQGQSRPASVVLFDPERDLAVLRAPGLGLAPLATGQGGPGTRGAAIGYPGGGPLLVSPAVIAGRFTARGRDIFNDRIVEREVWVVNTSVHPGSSGGPLVDEDGRLLGVIFAASATRSDQAYALTDAAIAPDLQPSAWQDTPIDTRRFACAR